MSTDARYSALLRHPVLGPLLATQALFSLGESVKMLALSVLVFDRTHSPTLAALAYVTGFLPFVVGGSLLLAHADTWPLRRTLVWCDIGRAGLALVLVLIPLPAPALLLLVFAAGVVTPVELAMRATAGTDASTQEQLPVLASLQGVLSTVAQLGGTAGGGALLLVIGSHGLLLLASFLAVVSAALSARLPLGSRRAASEAGSVAEAMTNRRLLGVPAFRLQLLIRCVPLVFAAGAEGLAVPLAAEAGSSRDAGLLFTAVTAGMLAGQLIVGRAVPAHLRERLAFPLVLLLGVPLLAFAWDLGLVATLIALFLSSAGLSYSLGTALRLVESIPEQHRGHGLGLVGTAMVLGQAAGALLAGGAAELWSPRSAAAACGVGLLFAAALLRRGFPAVRRGPAGPTA